MHKRKIGAFDQIPLKTQETGNYRLNSSTISWHSICTKLQNKETKLEDVLYNIYRPIQVF